MQNSLERRLQKSSSRSRNLSGFSLRGLRAKIAPNVLSTLLNTLRAAIYTSPWVAALPGAMIFAVSICCNLLSDGLRQAMDVTR